MSDAGLKFTFASKGSVFEDLVERAKRPKAILAQWGALLKTEAMELIAERAPPLAAATIKRQQHQGTSSITAHGNVRASHAKGVDTLLKRKGINATAELKRLVSGDTSRGSVGIKVLERLRRKVARAKAVKANGGTLATGRKMIERTGGERGGKFRKAWTRVYSGLGVSVENAWKRSAIHDTGGKVGNGAVLPVWNFTEIRQKVKDEMTDIAVKWLMGGIK